MGGGFFSEVRRRRVWRVAGAYVLVVWMGVEIVLETFPVLGFPDWVSRIVVILAIIGFPVTVILAWVFDITADGVIRTPPADPSSDTSPPRVVARTAPIRLAGVFGAGILVALVGFGAYSMFVPGHTVHPETIQAVAVLPFDDLSASQDQAYFADGVTDELINRLARLQEIRVAARTSSFALREEGAGLREIARRLNVDAVIEGSVRREGDQLRVSVELVDVATGFQIWAERYDRTVNDIFAIQDEISAAIVDALRLQLAPAPSRLGSGTAAVRAHDFYLLGLARWHARTDEDLRRALEYFEQAIEEDDSYAPAHAGLALTYAVMPAYTDIPVDIAAERGASAAARALALDAQLAEAHAAMGQIAQGLEWNMEAAEMAYRRAIENRPSFATGHQWHAETLLMMGRLSESRREIETALAIDPLSVSARNTLAYLLTVERRYEEAAAEYRALIRDHPDYVLAHAGLMLLCLAAECADAALASARIAYPAPVADAVEHVIRARRDPRAREPALGAVRGLASQLPPAHLALLLAAAGDNAAAAVSIERAFEEGEDPDLLFFLVHPLFDPVRSDPRFRRVADAVGVEAPTARVPAG